MVWLLVLTVLVKHSIQKEGNNNMGHSIGINGHCHTHHLPSKMTAQCLQHYFVMSHVYLKGRVSLFALLFSIFFSITSSLPGHSSHHLYSS